MPVAWSIGPARPTPAPSSRLAVDAGLREHLVDERDRGVEGVLGVVVDVDRAVRLREDRVAEVGDRHPQHRMVEVQAEHGAGAGVEGQEHGRAALRRAPRPRARRARRAGPRPEQLVDERGDGGAREARTARDVRARDAAAATDDLEHLQSVALTQGAQRARTPATHGAAPCSSRELLSSLVRNNSRMRARSFAARTKPGSAGRMAQLEAMDARSGEASLGGAERRSPWRACARRRRWSRRCPRSSPSSRMLRSRRIALPHRRRWYARRERERPPSGGPSAAPAPSPRSAARACRRASSSTSTTTIQRVRLNLPHAPAREDAAARLRRRRT